MRIAQTFCLRHLVLDKTKTKEDTKDSWSTIFVFLPNNHCDTLYSVQVLTRSLMGSCLDTYPTSRIPHQLQLDWHICLLWGG